VKILGQHKVSTNYIRSLAIDCLALDAVAFNLFVTGIHADEVGKTKEIYEEKLSSSLLNLAVAVRTLIYQGHSGFKDVSYCGFYESANQQDKAAVTIKDISDKLIHADSISREFEVGTSTEREPITIIEGNYQKNEWDLKISVSLYCESVLNWMNQLDNS
jgi:hypothetical protein